MKIPKNKDPNFARVIFRLNDLPNDRTAIAVIVSATGRSGLRRCRRGLKIADIGNPVDGKRHSMVNTRLASGGTRITSGDDACKLREGNPR